MNLLVVQRINNNSRACHDGEFQTWAISSYLVLEGKQQAAESIINHNFHSCFVRNRILIQKSADIFKTKTKQPITRVGFQEVINSTCVTAVCWVRVYFGLQTEMRWSTLSVFLIPLNRVHS